MKYLIDTDVLIWILRGKKEIINSMIKITKDKKQAISFISVTEIFKNIFLSEIKATETFLKAHFQLSMNFTIAKQSGLYWKKYNKQGKQLGILDCLIAATAKHHNLGVITCNVKHFPMKDIKIINPLQA